MLKKHIKRLLLAAAFLWTQLAWVAPVCYGEPASGSSLPNQTETMPGGGGETGDTFMMMLKVIFFLLIIIGLFFAIMKVLAKKNNLLFHKAIRSLGGVPLGQNKSIQIVEIGQSLYIVGVGDNIQLLEKVDNPDQVALITAQLTGPGTSVEGFPSVLQWLKGRKSGKVVEEEELTGTSFQEVFEDKMKHVTERKRKMKQWMQDEKQTDRLNEHE
ncbi:flagellar biosynthetic protein FliO [Paenibacillus larvae]|uniref:FliZ-like protein n=4 Tax=Paenibacillus larvae TaxID=1464 RepID=V9WA00_9BACL|nr:flagellar biosynthetic protein FliO [Paenibacillus larvae]AHD05947.1 FliZ-like protein [Paenibacillus larvae subsp. larvae DSM 25430]AQR76610.1 hypothetical protein BXP28_03620 [Paenibacillus larvae subsp. larvae]AVF22534.1 FliZ-like protein [Paenibacillus larvae subsp. larvae]AVF26867.1 FliZ-like protein [Paenibacillus larvae subsp. larvae]AVF31618.1 FliZ-like protein [Paenibacillus larvae subsp. larvae]